MRKILSLIVLMNLPQFCTAAGEAAGGVNLYNNKFMTARAYIELPSFGIEIDSKVNSGTKVLWKPAIRTLTGVDVSFNDFFIGGGYGWANNDTPGSAAFYGVSTYSDYRLGLTLKWVHVDADWQTFQGFYVDNSSAVNSAYGGSNPNIQDPNLTANSASVNGTFIMSPEKFSYAAALGQNERQETWGGSWLLGITAGELAFQSPHYLIPWGTLATYGQDAFIKNVQFYQLSVKGGYGYTFAWTRKWFTSLIFNLGLGGEFRTYGDGVNQTTAGGATTIVDGLISMGFNGDDFLAAIVATGFSTQYTTASLQVPETIGDVKLAIGGHF